MVLIISQHFTNHVDWLINFTLWLTVKLILNLNIDDVVNVYTFFINPYQSLLIPNNRKAENKEQEPKR